MPINIDDQSLIIHRNKSSRNLIFIFILIFFIFLFKQKTNSFVEHIFPINVCRHVKTSHSSQTDRSQHNPDKKNNTIFKEKGKRQEQQV